jgi:O-antigen biosynthesis protein
LLSVVVPTHDPKFLREAVQSVLAQTLDDFELLVVPNRGASLDGVLPEDPRIRVVRYEGSENLGALKKFALEAATGEMLVELDHDDLLAPHALARIHEAFASSDAGFVYSNFASFREETGEPVTYDPHYGWTWRDIDVLGRRVRESVAFSPSAASLSQVWYAPYHVRAWRRDFYSKIGGHNPEISFGSDHDVLVRAYLAGTMAHVDECLYLQREHPDCQHVLHGEEIQASSREIYAASIESLVLTWAGRAGLPCYDLNNIQSPAKGWVTVSMEGQLMQVDLRGRWPWGDSSVGAFRAVDCLAFLPDKMQTMSEIHRCLAGGGWLLSATPSALGHAAYMDPRFQSFWTRNSFYVWTDPSVAAELRNNSAWFQTHRLEEGFPTDWHRQHAAPYVLFDAQCLKGAYSGPGPRNF